MKNKFAVCLSSFILCYGFWFLLTWSAARRELILGALVSLGAALFAGRFLVHSDAFYLFHPLRLMYLLVYCCVIFLSEAIKANLAMAALVFSPRRSFHSEIVRIRADDGLKSEYGLAMVSNSITLTPGTITMDVAEGGDGANYYYVHWLDAKTTDREQAGEMIKGRMERWIRRIWK